MALPKTRMDDLMVNPFILFRRLVGAYFGLGGVWDVEEFDANELELTDRLPIAQGKNIRATTLGDIKDKFGFEVGPAPVPIPNPNPTPSPTETTHLVSYFQFPADSRPASCLGTFYLDYGDGRRIISFVAGQSGPGKPFLKFIGGSIPAGEDNAVTNIKVVSNVPALRCEVWFTIKGSPDYKLSIFERGWVIPDTTVADTISNEATVSLPTHLVGAETIIDTDDLPFIDHLERRSTAYERYFTGTIPPDAAEGQVLDVFVLPEEVVIKSITLQTSEPTASGGVGITAQSYNLITETEVDSIGAVIVEDTLSSTVTQDLNVDASNTIRVLAVGTAFAGRTEPIYYTIKVAVLDPAIDPTSTGENPYGNEAGDTYIDESGNFYFSD